MGEVVVVVVVMGEMEGTEVSGRLERKEAWG